MTTISATSPRPPTSDAARAAADRPWLDNTAMVRGARIVALWLHRARSRKALSEMPVERLADIGLDAESAAREYAKPFWR